MSPSAPLPGLFSDLPGDPLPDGIVHLPGAVGKEGQKALLAAVRTVAEAAPFSRPRTKGGQFSAAITNCGAVGWWSDARGYRYAPAHPDTGAPWPAMPEIFLQTVAAVAPGFHPDACLINFYGAGAKMGLHQDRDEKDFTQPIVTVSLGDAADFLIGGATRADKTRAIVVASGDVLIMGGASRMRFHGVRKIYPGTSPLDLQGRISLTFRKAL